MAILVTGGAGFIGSHTCVELLNAGKDIIVLDNFSNSSPVSLERVKKITGRDFISFDVDLTDRDALSAVFEENEIESVIHFAAWKAVSESCEKPLEYYMNNVCGTLILLETMVQNSVKKIVFSSSATVYGTGEPPFSEASPVGGITNPYGQTKLMMEQIMTDLYNSDNSFSIVLLRYFNPIGAHESGEIGENPLGIPNNLFPNVLKAATSETVLPVYGDDYDTPDGSCIRDYIHVMDLANGHVKAVDLLGQGAGLQIINLGTGKGTSVFEMLTAFEKVTGISVPYEINPRRQGDLPNVYAVCDKAEKVLSFKANRTIEDMCRDSWNWTCKNPKGFEG